MSFFADLLTLIKKIYLIEVSLIGALLYTFGAFIHLSFEFALWSIYTRIALGLIWLCFIVFCFVVYSVQGGKK